MNEEKELSLGRSGVRLSQLRGHPGQRFWVRTEKQSKDAWSKQVEKQFDTGEAGRSQTDYKASLDHTPKTSLKGTAEQKG